MGMAAVSCSNDVDEIKSIVFGRNFSPTNFKAELENNVDIKFTWSSPAAPEKYIVELYKIDTLLNTSECDSTIEVAPLQGKETDTLLIAGLEEKTLYTAKIKAVGNGKEDSYWTELGDTIATKKGSTPAPVPVEVTHPVSFTEAIAAGSMPATLGDGVFVITPTDPNNKISVDANKCYFYEKGGEALTRFDYRMKTGGKSSATANFLTLTIPGDGILYIYVRTGSNSDTTRDVVVTQNDETLIDYILNEDEMKTAGVEAEGEELPVNVYKPIEVKVKKGTAVITYPVNGVNFYGFTLVSVDSNEEGDEEDQEPQGPTGEEGEITFEAGAAVADGAVYKFGSASITINNAGAKFAIDANTQYFGDANAQTKYEARMKTGAKNGDTNGIALTLAAKGTLTIAMRSSSSSADRTVSIVDATGAALETWTVGDANATEGVTIEGEAEPKKVFHTYTVTLEAGTYNFTYDGGLNFYSIKYQP